MSAKELTSLILDEERLRYERQHRQAWKSRVRGLDEVAPGDYGIEEGRRRRERPNRNNEEDDLEYRLALEASKNEAEEDRKRREQGGRSGPDDDDLAKAIKLSREEEDLRRRELEDNNAQSLFDDAPAQANQPQSTGWNQGYQQQGAVDWFGNPVDQQQPQSTGFLNNAYAQPSAPQNQQTGFQNSYNYNPYQQSQPTGLDTAQFQQPQQTQQPFLQPQQTSFHVNNPYSQQSSEFGVGNQQQQPVQQQEPAPQAGSQNPWASNSTSVDNIKPQPTGSNNPFASSLTRPQTSSAVRPPTLGTLHEQRTQTQFSQPFGQSSSSPFTSQTPTQPQPQPQSQPQFQPQIQPQSQKDQNPHHNQLNQLLQSGEGQDTFGNTGNLRIPAQHTAPGTFVNSAGQGLNRIPANQTGNNPFLHNQFTGVPPQRQLAPAQTGPAGAFSGGGVSSSNPFGAQQRQSQQPQGGSLIDL